MAVDLLRNKPRYETDAPVTLRPFDGRVGAILRVGAETFYITTKCDYIPAPTFNTDVYLHDDMRFGVHDPTLWPQSFSNRFFHLAAMPKRELRSDLALLWWKPTPQNFIVGDAMTRGLGRLDPAKLRPFIEYAVKLRERYRAFKATAKSPPEYLAELVDTIILSLERLNELPTTYERTKFALASFQTNCLELEALLDFLTVYQPILKNPDAPEPTRVAPCVGTFTTVPEVAQKLDRAGLPFWFIRPTHTFDNEVILKVVTIQEPPFDLTAERPPDNPLVYSGTDIDSKIIAMNKASRAVGWYRPLFGIPHSAPTQPSSSTDAVPAHSSSSVEGAAHRTSSGAPAGSSPLSGSSIAPARQSSSVGPARTPRTPAHPRPSPYDRPVARGRAQPGGRGHRGRGGAPGQHQASASRDKFKPFDVEEMPTYIKAWADALQRVDQTNTSSSAAEDKHYVFPEPALVASPQLAVRRTMFLHHWRLVKDAMTFRVSEGGDLLSSQEWRDILEGRTERQGHRNKRTANSRSLNDIIGPSLCAVGIDALHGFPPAAHTIPIYNQYHAKQIIWEIAEVNYRFEFLALDHRASGRDRSSFVKMCFSGGSNLFNVPLQWGKQGIASEDINERHKYYVRMARLMSDWRVLTPRPKAVDSSEARRDNIWTEQEMMDLEWGVARFYTQSFFELFGRAAVLPMRLEHDLVDLPGVTR
ncbi:hypothetical protein B0H12DRAFT_1246758 [Mycena haematopus]|nr:hypothetical protein B0H12DRAFT_1246758 [Mycena haematopus]